VDGLYADTVWINNTTSTGNFLSFDLGAAKLVDEIAFWYHGGNFGTWKWQGSPDNSTWTDIGGTFTLAGANNPCLQMRQLNGNTTPYRYYRMLCVNGATYSADGWMQEMEFRVGTTAAAASNQPCFFVCM
jgi:hypothetical protein